MKLPPALISELAVAPGAPAGLDRRSTSSTKTDWLGPLGISKPRQVADEHLESFKSELGAAQELLYSSDRWSLLLIFQALDAGGKDGTIKHVMSGLNPQGCDVHSFKQPSATELRHDFLWRCALALPERGRLGIFNRSYYEEVLVVRVHPEMLAAEGESRARWDERFEDINAFERHLERSKTLVVKFFLHVSEDEQRRRLIERLERPEKQWKFSPSDLTERRRFAEYQQAYEEALTATSTPWSRWYVVPADHKHAMRALVGGIVVHAIDRLDLSMPVPDPAQMDAIAAARRELGAGSD